MSTLAVIATSTLTGVIGAAAMYVPARLALRDARTYRDEADRTFNAAESLADEVERTRNLPWHYAIEAAPEDKPVIGEVLHVEPHETGEHPVVESEHKPTCPDLYYCPTVDEVESGCHGGFAVCCYAPEMHVPIPDERDDDEVGEEQPGESDWSWLRFVGATLLFPFAWLVFRLSQLAEWFRSLGATRRERHMVGSGEQATDGDPFAELLAHVEDGDVEERQVEIEAWVQANPPTPPSYKPWHLNDVTAMHEVVRPGRHRAAEIPAQREAAE